MANVISSFFIKHKYVCYAYILWLIAHIILLIVGNNTGYFFPFGYHFFNTDDYGFLEFFVYVIAIPVTLYVFIDIIRQNEQVRIIMKWIAYLLLLAASSLCVFLWSYSVLGGFFGYIDVDMLNTSNLGRYLFDFYHGAYIIPSKIICFVVCCILSLFYAFKMIKLKKNEESRFVKTMCFIILFFVYYGVVFYLADEGYEWAFVLILVPFMIWGVYSFVHGKDDRIRKRTLRRKYGRHIGRDIFNSRVRLGMTIEQCLESWGPPLDTYDSTHVKNRINSYSRETTQLVYNQYNLFFTGKTLSRIEKRDAAREEEEAKVRHIPY